MIREPRIFCRCTTARKPDILVKYPSCFVAHVGKYIFSTIGTPRSSLTLTTKFLFSSTLLLLLFMVFRCVIYNSGETDHDSFVYCRFFSSFTVSEKDEKIPSSVCVCVVLDCYRRLNWKLILIFHVRLVFLYRL